MNVLQVVGAYVGIVTLVGLLFFACFIIFVLASIIVNMMIELDKRSGIIKQKETDIEDLRSRLPEVFDEELSEEGDDGTITTIPVRSLGDKRQSLVDTGTKAPVLPFRRNR